MFILKLPKPRLFSAGIMGLATLFVLLTHSFGHAQSKVVFKGYVLNAYDSMPIEAAHIYRADEKQGTFADVLGHFSIQVTNNDTLFVSAVGFGTQKLLISLISDTGILEGIVWMVPSPRWLEGITVTPEEVIEPNYRLRLIDTDSSYFPEKEKIVEFSGSSVTGLVTLLASQFNNDYKQIKKLRGIKEEEYKIWYEKQLIKRRLNAAFVTRNTSILSNEVADFIKFWSPIVPWLERVSDYELILKMREIEKDYINNIKNTAGKSDSAQATTLELRKLLDN